MRKLTFLFGALLALNVGMAKPLTEPTEPVTTTKMVETNLITPALVANPTDTEQVVCVAIWFICGTPHVFVVELSGNSCDKFATAFHNAASTYTTNCE